MFGVVSQEPSRYIPYLSHRSASRIKRLPRAMASLSCHLWRHLSGCRAVLNHAPVFRSRYTVVRTGSTQVPLAERRPLVLKASEFRHLFEEGPTEKIYAGTPLSGLGQTQQGMAVEEWARKVLQEKNPEAEILDPERGPCCNGSRRGWNMTLYDFLLNGQRMEIKSSRMSWSSTRRWSVRFASVKLAHAERVDCAFDDLYLVILSPKGLHLIKHDLVTGVGKEGKLVQVSGHAIRVHGSRGTNCWEDALDEIMKKLCERGACSMVYEQPFSQLDFQTIAAGVVSPGQEAVAGIPMSSMSGGKRGNRIENIGLAIDRRLHPNGDFSFAKGSCGRSNAPADWVRCANRVELKSCALTFNRSKNRWLCDFQHIKPDLFDELWLAIYTSVGIYYYRSKRGNSLAFCNVGARTQIQGHSLLFYGPQSELDPLGALKTIQAKMISRGCELVAIVEWEEGVMHQLSG